MANNTIGGLIKDYRIRKRISQGLVSSGMGWSDTSRLSKIEQGRAPKLKRDTLDRLISALGMDESEKGELLYQGGYQPTEEEVGQATDLVKSTIDSWQYPAYLMDFSWRWLYANEATLMSIDIPVERKAELNSSRMTILEAAFLPKDKLPAEIYKGEDPGNLKPLAVAQIASFKNENFRFENEIWYKKLIEHLMQYPEFGKLWPVISQNDYPKKLQDCEYEKVTFTRNGRKIVLTFHLYTSKLINSPRFQVVFYHPADDFTREYFNKRSD